MTKLTHLFNRIIIVGAFTVASTLSLAHSAAAQETVGDISVKFTGQKNWKASCSVTKSNGKTATIVKKGRGRSSSETFSMRKVTSGDCTLDVPEGTGLTVSFTSRKLACPFNKEDTCVVVAAPGEQRFSFGG